MEHNRLLRTIEEQNRKLENYQKKLRGCRFFHEIVKMCYVLKPECSILPTMFQIKDVSISRTNLQKLRVFRLFCDVISDVVQAYKDLSKEKAALEATVGALNQSLEKTSSEKAGGNEGALKGTSDPNNVSQVVC